MIARRPLAPHQPVTGERPSTSPGSIGWAVPLIPLDLRRHPGPLADALPRPPDPGSDVREVVAGIVARVREGGDEAVRALTAELDGVSLTDLRVPPEEIEAAAARIPADLRRALEVARDHVRDYHAHEGTPPDDFVDDGLRVRHLVRPVERAGCYAPGGRARYPSTVIMCAVPARVAGVREVVLCVPPGPDGRVDDATLAAAAVAGLLWLLLAPLFRLRRRRVSISSTLAAFGARIAAALRRWASEIRDSVAGLREARGTGVSIAAAGDETRGAKRRRRGGRLMVIAGGERRFAGAFRRLARWGGDRGAAFATSLGPQEYATLLASRVPDLRAELERIAELYELQLFSPAPLSGRERSRYFKMIKEVVRSGRS